jgi:hypothetical protein
MALRGLYRYTVLLLLLVFPAQLLALAYLPCRHAESPADRPTAHCHVSAGEQAGPSQADDSGRSSYNPQDCSKCQIQLAFSSMHDNAVTGHELSHAAPSAIRSSLVHFYHLYPDSLKRPPRPLV